MIPKRRLVLLLAVVSVLLITAGCASQSQVDRLEEDVRLLEIQVKELSIQQQSIDAGLAESISATNARVESLDQRLTAQDMAITDLAQTDDETAGRISEIDSQLDDRTINSLLKHWLTYVATVAVLLTGIFIGIWGVRCKESRDKPAFDGKDTAPNP